MALYFASILILFPLTRSITVTGETVMTYFHTLATFGSGYTANVTTGSLAIAEPFTVCDGLDNNVTDMVVLAKRYGIDSSCPYERQSLIVQNAGGIGIIITDNEYRTDLLTLSYTNISEAREVKIPVVYITRDSGEDIEANLLSNGTLTILIDASTEYNPLVDKPGRLGLFIYQMLLLITWIVSICYYSDHNIIKRMTNARKRLYHRIRPMIYSRSTYEQNLRQISHISLWNSRCMDQENMDYMQQYHDVCPICIEEFHFGDIVKMLPCKHVFHCSCLDPWFLKQSPTCPVCKKKITNKGMEKVSQSSIDNELSKEIKKQRCVVKFWCYFWIVNIVLYLLTL